MNTEPSQMPPTRMPTMQVPQDNEIDNAADTGHHHHYAPHDTLTKRELRQYIFTATLTALGLGLVIVAGMVLFILFCVYVWL